MISAEISYFQNIFHNIYIYNGILLSKNMKINKFYSILLFFWL